jgi:hypothetical protein
MIYSIYNKKKELSSQGLNISPTNNNIYTNMRGNLA